MKNMTKKDKVKEKISQMLKQQDILSQYQDTFKKISLYLKAKPKGSDLTQEEAEELKKILEKSIEDIKFVQNIGKNDKDK